MEEVQVTASKLPQYSLSPERLAQIDAAYGGDRNELNTARKSASGDSGTITTAIPDSQRKGNRAVYLYNEILNGIGRVASGLGDLGVQFTNKIYGIDNGDQILKAYREEFAPGLREEYTNKLGADLDKGLKSRYQNETFTGALGGLAQSTAPILLTAGSGGLGTGAMFLQSYDSALESINQSEAGQNLDETTKTAFAGGVAIVTATLEKYGLDKIFKGETGVISNLIARKALEQAERQTAGKVTGDVFTKFLDKEVLNLSNRFVKGGTKALDGALVEYGTEALQEGAQAGAEILVNKLTGKPVFDISETSKWDGFLARMNKAGIAGAIGGGLLGGVAGLANLSKGDVVKQEQSITDIDNALANESLSDASREVLVQRKIDLQNRLQETAGKIDMAYDKLDPKQKDEVNGIIEEKVKLQEAINDPALSEDIKASLQEQSDTLDKQLSEIKPVEATKESNATETTTQEKESVTEPKIASNEETAKISEQQVPKTEETVAKTGEESVKVKLTPEQTQSRNKGIERVLTTKKADIESVGDKTEYEDYLKTVFPDSEVKNIAYHDTDKDFGDFQQSENGIFTTGQENWWQSGKNKKVMLVDTKNAMTVEGGLNSGRTKDLFDANPEVDTIITTGDSKDIGQGVYVVRNPDQIHELGSKKDLEGFKKWKESKTSLAKPKYTIKGEMVTPKVEDNVVDAENNHAEFVKNRFKEQFESKGIPKEQVNGAIALMDARAKSWASEGKGRTPEQWYKDIADVKSGEFTPDKQTGVKYQLFSGSDLKRNLLGKVTGVKEFAIKEINDELRAIETNAKKSGRWLLAPNGKPTKLTPDAWKMVRTKRFKEWFGDWRKDPKNSSKIVDENGEPVLYYSGSKDGFDAFDKKYFYTGEGAMYYGAGFYFTPRKSTASSYSKQSKTNESLGRIRKEMGNHGFEDILKEINKLPLTSDKNSLPQIRKQIEKITTLSDKAINSLEKKISKGSGAELENDINKRLLNGFKRLKSEMSSLMFSTDPTVYRTGTSYSIKGTEALDKAFDYLTQTISNKQEFGEAEGNVFSVFLNVKNPLDWERSVNPSLVDKVKRELGSKASSVDFSTVKTGGQLYKKVADALNEKMAPTGDVRQYTKTSEFFNSIGIDGISHTTAKDWNRGTYFNQAAGEKQIIAFEPNAIKEASNSGTFSSNTNNIRFQENDSQAKGAVETLEDGKVVIHALNSPDFSTMVHEIAHVFEKDLTEAQKATIDELGGSENFARGFERYLRDGKAPTPELTTLFDKFKNWLINIYQNLKGSPIEKQVSPELKKIFDGLLTETKENVNTPNEPNVGGETKANAEVVQPTSNDEGGNGAQVERVTEETVKPSFDELATRSLEGDVVKNTLSNVERETNTKLDKTISEYNAADFKSAFVQGEQTVQAAKEEFGKDYVSKFTDYVKESKMPFENKAVMLVSLENDLRKQYLENPTPQLKKQVDLATKNSIEFLRSSARATGVGIFRQAARANYETEAASEAIFSPKERQERTKVEEAVQSTSEDVQKEYEARQEIQTDAVVQEAIDKGVQARIDDIYEALPSSRKQAADKAISALERIQKKLRSRTYDASIGIPVAIIDAGITTIKQAIKAGVKVADAIELGINKIKERYGKEWKNEDKFRKDMLEGFSEENIDVQDGTRTSKTSDKLKQELIDAGYSKEITVNTKNGKEKRNTIDWKKLTGIEGSFDRMKENLEESLNKKGYSGAEINEFQKQLEDEYNDIHADIIQKSLNELNRRNTPREATAKTLARRLAELYNLGLYDRDVDTYSNILNNALGISPKSQAAFNEIRDFNRSLAQLLDSRGVNGKRLTDLEIITAENEIKAHIQKVIQKVQFAEGNGFFKFSDVMKNIFSAMQRMMLAKISQLIENPFSGALNDTQVKLQDAFSKKKWDTKELRENRTILGRAIYEDTSLRGGDEYGGVGNPFTTKNSIESFVNGLYKNSLYQAFVGALSGRQYLDATDSYFKIKRTEKEFTNNLLRILTDKTNPNGAMDQNDALRFVSEALTGQSFNQAKETARGIITSINDKAGKEIIRPAETNVTRIANDLVKDNLVLGGKMNTSEVESAFKAAYKTAGKSIGHESNNLITDVVNATNQTIQRKLDEALKKKDWSTAAVLNLTSILSKNIVNPFVGGGTNWTVIGLQKMGLPTEWIRSDVGFSKKPIDLATKEGLKELKDNLSANATRQRQFGRIMTGTLTALAAVMAVRYSGDEEEYKKWLKSHPDTRKLINKIQPVPLTLYLARDNKNNEFIKSIASTLGSRYNAQTDGDKLFQAVSDFWDGYNKGNEKKIKKAWGTVGQLMGRRINVPYVSSISNYGDMGNKLYKEFVGKPVKDPYKSPKGFVDGYFKGGLMDYLNITPQDLQDDKK